MAFSVAHPLRSPLLSRRPVRHSWVRRAAWRASADATPVLYSVPVSNFSARCRYIVYDNDLPIKIESPGAQMKTDEYAKRVHKFGKIPALVWPDGRCGSLWESQIITEYLVDKHGLQDKYLPQGSAEKLARMRLYARVHDLYLTQTQPVLYRQTATEQEREHGLQQLEQRLDILEEMLAEDDTGSLAVERDRITLADICLLPTLAMYDAIMPVWHGRSVFGKRPRLHALYREMQQRSPTAVRIVDEVRGAVRAWEDGGRFENIGLRRQAPSPA
ncbi:hypothetical protein CDCA_CDCA15G4031 [Cyanidium caldarium]|uniref:Glutathione S-transferase n=1 Tax=Cyanidium caldarium TaxID=2771 RepID=A0AAV9J0S5_CYACA|nr:hypothetical protein CDCA_CDCA15G4031 [Cyanidium caldarium]